MTKRTTKIYPDPRNPEFFYRVRVIRARKEVVLSREDIDVLEAAKGDTVSCMNANCAKRSAAEGAFPHPCFLAVFNASSAFIVHRKTEGGIPTHAMWYKHNNGGDIDIHDRMGPEEIIRRGFAKRLVLLKPPKDRTGENAGKGARPRESTGVQKSHKAIGSVGAARRALKAGILSLPDVMRNKKKKAA